MKEETENAGNTVIICRRTAAHLFILSKNSFDSGGVEMRFRGICYSFAEDLHHGCGTPGMTSVGHLHWKSHFGNIIIRGPYATKKSWIAKDALEITRNNLAPRQDVLKETSPTSSCSKKEGTEHTQT